MSCLVWWCGGNGIGCGGNGIWCGGDGIGCGGDGIGCSGDGVCWMESVVVQGNKEWWPIEVI